MYNIEKNMKERNEYDNNSNNNNKNDNNINFAITINYITNLFTRGRDKHWVYY